MELIPTLKALADESRLRLFAALAHGALNVQELTGIVGLTQPTVSHHLRTLQQAGLVESRKEGTWIYYALAAKTPLLTEIENSLHVHNGSLGDILARDKVALDELFDRRRDAAHRFFEEVAPRWGKLREEIPGHAVSIDSLIDRIPSTGAVLELGCGTGSILQKLIDREGPIIGVDSSQAMVNEAKRALGTGKCELRLGYLEHLPVADDAVNHAIAYMVFHHVSEPSVALREVARVTAPGGTLHIVDLVKHGHDFMRDRYGDLWLGFEPAEFARWVEEAGFSDVRVELLGNGEAFLLAAGRSGNEQPEETRKGKPTI